MDYETWIHLNGSELSRFVEQWVIKFNEPCIVTVSHRPSRGHAANARETPPRIRIIGAHPLKDLPERLNHFMDNWHLHKNEDGCPPLLLIHTGRRWHFRHESYTLQPVLPERFLSQFASNFMLTKPMVPTTPYVEALPLESNDVPHYTINGARKLIICNGELVRNEVHDGLYLPLFLLHVYICVARTNHRIVENWQKVVVYIRKMMKLHMLRYIQDVINPSYLKNNQVLPYDIPLSLFRFFLRNGKTLFCIRGVYYLLVSHNKVINLIRHAIQIVSDHLENDY